MCGNGDVCDWHTALLGEEVFGGVGALATEPAIVVVLFGPLVALDC